jgi:DNA-binding beta-propeller fold protein YncE
MQISSDGQRLYISSNSSNEIWVYDTSYSSTPLVLDSRSPIQPQYGQGAGSSGFIAISPDNTRIYLPYSGYDGPAAITIINTATLSNITTIATEQGFTAVVVSPDNKYLYGVTLSPTPLTGGGDALYAYSINGDSLTQVATGSCSNVQLISISPENSILYTVSNPGSAAIFQMFDTKTLEPVGTPVGLGPGPMEMAVSGDGTRVFVTTIFDNTLWALIPSSFQPA